MGQDPQICLTKIDENNNMKDEIRTKVAETDAIVVNQPTEKRMNWDPKSTDEVIIKNNKFIGMGHGEILTNRQAPSHCRPVWNLEHHQVVECPLITD